MWFGLGSVACVTAALAMLLTVRWRWVALLFAFLSVSALVIRNGPIYAPTRVFLWYAAYRGIAVYAPIFHAAWLILAGASFMLVVATWRLMRAAAMPRAPSDPQRDPSRGAGGPSDMRPGGHAASAVRTPASDAGSRSAPAKSGAADLSVNGPYTVDCIISTTPG